MAAKLSHSGRVPARLASAAPAVLVVLSFVSSGAWWFVTLPPAPIAKALNLMTLAVWLAAFGLSLVGFVRPDRRILWALGAVVASIALSFIAGGSHFAVGVLRPLRGHAAGAVAGVPGDVRARGGDEGRQDRDWSPGCRWWWRSGLCSRWCWHISR